MNGTSGSSSELLVDINMSSNNVFAVCLSLPDVEGATSRSVLRCLVGVLYPPIVFSFYSDVAHFYNPHQL